LTARNYKAVMIMLGLYLALTRTSYKHFQIHEFHLSLVIRLPVQYSPTHQVQGCRTGPPPSYLGPFTYVADLSSRRGLRSFCSDCLVQPPVHRRTVGSRAFSVAGPQVWNCLPSEVTSAPSLETFRTRLETFLFTESYPDIRLI